MVHNVGHFIWAESNHKVYVKLGKSLSEIKVDLEKVYGDSAF